MKATFNFTQSGTNVISGDIATKYINVSDKTYHIRLTVDNYRLNSLERIITEHNRGFNKSEEFNGQVQYIIYSIDSELELLSICSEYVKECF